MTLFPVLRSLARAAAGRRPRQQDLEAIVADMRGRLLRGRPVQRLAPPRLPPGFATRRLRALQLRKLRRTVRFVAEHVPWYRETLGSAGLGPRDIRSLDDLRRLPITHRHDLEQRRDDFISRAPGMTASVCMHTSGTTGRPLDLFLSRDEFDYYAAVQAIAGMVGGFLGPEHVLVLQAGLAYSITAQVYTAAAQKSGALVINVDLSENLDKTLDFLLADRTVPGKRPKVSGLLATPASLWGLTARAERRGLSSADSGLRRIFTCGAAVSEGLRERVRTIWGVSLREAYSTVETAATGAIECDHGRLHFLDLSGILEILDPGTHEPVATGQPGMAVITALYPDRELMPLLRYWTQDLMVASAETSCECGMVSTIVDEILGRADQMVVVGGQNLYPHSVGDVLVSLPGLLQPPRFRVHVEERPDAQHLVVEVEHEAGLPEEAKRETAARILAALPTTRTLYIRSGIIRCDVRLVEPGSIREPFRYKLQGITHRSA